LHSNTPWRLCLLSESIFRPSIWGQETAQDNTGRIGRKDGRKISEISTLPFSHTSLLPRDSPVAKHEGKVRTLGIHTDWSTGSGLRSDLPSEDGGSGNVFVLFLDGDKADRPGSGQRRDGLDKGGENEQGEAEEGEKGELHLEG
jgi:hypothetical protein